MNPISRRDIVAVGAAGGLLAATSPAMGPTGPQGPQPNRAPGLGGSDPGPRDLTRDRENRDMLNPPSTDQGTLPNLRFSFAAAHTRQTDPGWRRQGPTCFTAPPASPRLTRMAIISSTTWASATCGISRAACRIRSRD